MADQFAAFDKPAAPQEDSFAAFDKPSNLQAVADPFATFDAPSQGIPVQQGAVIPPEQMMAQSAVQTGQEIASAAGAIPGVKAVYDYAKSPISTLVEYLQRPQQFATGIAIKAADLLGDKTISKDLNPDNLWLPEAAPHDLLYRYLPSNDSVEKAAKDIGASETQASISRLGYALGKGAGGFALDVVTDPLMMISGIGGLTKEAEQAYKTGQYVEDVVKAAEEGKSLPALKRNIVSFKLPFAGEVASIPAEPVSKAAAAMSDRLGSMIDKAASKVPFGVEAVDSVKRKAAVAKEAVMSFTPFTGIMPVDVARAEHLAAESADKPWIVSKLKELKADTNANPGEGLLIANAMETTPELDVFKQHLKPHEYAQLGTKVMVEPELREWLKASIEEAAQKKKISLAPGRSDDLAEAALRLKKENSGTQILRLQSGAAAGDEIASGMRSGYLAHRIDPAAKRALKLSKNPIEAERQAQQLLVEEAGRVLQDKTPSTFDTAKMKRELNLAVEEANAVMKKKYGVDKAFIEDPFSATTIKAYEIRRFIRNRELLNKIAPFAKIPKNASEERALLGQGFVKINAPMFGKATVEVGEQGKKISYHIDELMFPREAARKLNYDFNKYSGPLVAQTAAKAADSYYGIFRNFVLFKPDYWLENWIDNFSKGVMFGVKNSDYVDAAKVMMGKNGKIGDRSVEEVRQVLKNYSVKTGNIYAEEQLPSLDSILYTGKRVMFERGLKGAGKAAYTVAAAPMKMPLWIIHHMNTIGESGENLQRTAYFISRIKQGYSVPMALYETEKVLFNFKRSTLANDWAKRLFLSPFVSAAFKTTFLAPEMLSRAPRFINQYENNLMKALENAMSDPVTSWAQHQLFPATYRFHDRIAGPLLPGNHWMLTIAGFGPNKDQPLPFALNLGLPGGLGILNQFALWDEQQMKSAVGGNPLLRSFVIMATGRDPFLGNDVDINRNAPEFTRRLNYAFRSFAVGTMGSPNAERIIAQKLGIGDPQYFTPDAVLMLQGSMGKFGRLTNLSKEFLSRQMAFAAIEKELNQKLRTAARQELAGKTAQTASGGVIAQWALEKRAYTNAEVYRGIQDQVAAFQKQQVSAEILQGKKYTVTELAGLIRNIQTTAKQSSDTYAAAMRQYLEEVKKNANAKDPLLKATGDNP